MVDRKHTARPELERHARRIAWPARHFVLIALALAVPAVLLLLLTHGWAWALGIVLAALALIPATVGVALLGSAAVAHWASHERPFA